MGSSRLTDTERRHMGLATPICEVVVDERHVLGSFPWYPSIEHVCRGLDLINPAAFVLVLATYSSRAVSVPSLLQHPEQDEEKQQENTQGCLACFRNSTSSSG